jgi:endo-1,4-beta-xylanase
MDTILRRAGNSSIVLVGIMLLGIAGMANAQLVTNGSFESSNTGVVSGTDVKGWLIQAASGVTPPPVFEIVSDTVQQGNRAMKVTVHGLGTNQWDIQIVADSIPVTPGKTYNYSVWAKCEKPGAVVNFTMGNYAYTEYKALRPANLSTRWQKYTMQFTVNDNETVIRGPIHFYSAADTGNAIYVDNLHIVDVNAGKLPVIVEAESGTLGSGFSVLQDGSVNYITANTDYAGLTSPGDTSRMATYQVIFQDSGFYNLFARLRVGPNTYNDDSYFYAHGFGAKRDTAGADWILVNGLASAGFSDSAAVVDGPGSLGTQLWKWVNVTKNTYQGTPGDSFYVHIDSLIQTFQIGSRENGLDIDKIAFGKSSLYFTVGALDNVLPGTPTKPGGGTVWTGPAFAAGMSKFIGCTYNGPDVNFANYWTQVTPGNAGKFGTVAVSADSSQWNWTTLDAAHNLAVSNHLVFKDHCLIWGQQQPSWLTGSGLDSAQQASAVEQWIRLVGARYPTLDMVDVVNEPLPGHNPAPYSPALGGAGSTGWDWVIWAFTKARQYMPNTKLLLNDYGIINSNSATDSYLQIINILKNRGLIDGIGVQGHRFELESADTSVMKANLDKLAATGLPVYISEFDLGNLGNSGTPDDNQQLQLYQKIFPILWKHLGVKGITIWDYLEGQTWQTTCYLVRSDGTARPALLWLAQYVKDNPVGVPLDAPGLPSTYALEQNFPNPFNPTTSISYSIPTTCKVTLRLFDILGREVQTLVNTVQVPGRYTATLNAQNLATGAYIYRISAGNFSATKKLMLVK